MAVCLPTAGCGDFHRNSQRLQSKATSLVGRKPQTVAQTALNCFQKGTGSKGEFGAARSGRGWGRTGMSSERKGVLSANSRLQRFSPEFAAACGIDLPNGPKASSSRWSLKSTSLLIFSGKSFPLRRRIARLQSKATSLVGRKPPSDEKAEPNWFQYRKGSKRELGKRVGGCGDEC